MAKMITEKVIKWITLDNQLISVVEDQGFLRHLEILNPWYFFKHLTMSCGLAVTYQSHLQILKTSATFFFQYYTMVMCIVSLCSCLSYKDLNASD